MASEIDAHLGKRLRRRRWMLALTQSQLGAKVGIKFQQVQKYETGQNRVSAARLWDLARALDVPVAYFYEGLGEADEPETAEPPAKKPAEATAVKGDPLEDREAIELVRCYYEIPAVARRRLFDLVKSLGDIGGARAPNGDDLRLRAG